MKNLVIGIVIGAVGAHMLVDGKKSLLKKSKEMLKEKVDSMLAN